MVVSEDRAIGSGLACLASAHAPNEIPLKTDRARNLEEALELLNKSRYDLIIATDFDKAKEGSSRRNSEAVGKMKEAAQKTRIVLYTDIMAFGIDKYDLKDAIRIIKRMGADDIIYMGKNDLKAILKEFRVVYRGRGAVMPGYSEFHNLRKPKK